MAQRPVAVDVVIMDDHIIMQGSDGSLKRQGTSTYTSGERLLLKVLAFTDWVASEASGGVERQILEIYPRLVASGIADIRLVALSSRAQDDLTVERGVHIRKVQRTSLVGLTGAQVALSKPLWRIAWSEFRDFRPDIIHANTLFYATSLAAAWLARRTGTPLVLTSHIGDVNALPQPYRAITQLYERTVGRLLLHTSSTVICIGSAVERHIHMIAGDRCRTVVIPNGVDTEKFSPPKFNRKPGAKPIVVSVGRLIFNKGNHFLVQAANVLASEGYVFELWIVGDGPMYGTLQTMASELLPAGTVRMLGHCDDVPNILRTSDIFVRPSLTESMPMGVLEAMATALPVVASDVGATAELITHGVNGLLVPPASPAHLVAALARLISDPNLRQRMGKHGRRRALQFDWDTVAQSTANVFHQVIRYH